MITQLNAAATSETVLTRKWSCLWRPDVGSSLYARSSWQKAGGVGGLAWLQTGAAQTMASDNNPAAPSLQGTCEIHIPMADHMGNIRNYIHARSTAVDDGSGTGSTYAMVNFTPSANFEYDAFGREVRANGTTVAATNTPPGLTAGTAYADALPFHFSSKFTDLESGLNYYGYRYYDPKDGRWLGRDPMGEEGGLNPYSMLENDALSVIDLLGLKECEGHIINSSFIEIFNSVGKPLLPSQFFGKTAEKGTSLALQSLGGLKLSIPKMVPQGAAANLAVAAKMTVNYECCCCLMTKGGEQTIVEWAQSDLAPGVGLPQDAGLFPVNKEGAASLAAALARAAESIASQIEVNCLSLCSAPPTK